MLLMVTRLGWVKLITIKIYLIVIKFWSVAPVQIRKNVMSVLCWFIINKVIKLFVLSSFIHSYEMSNCWMYSVKHNMHYLKSPHRTLDTAVPDLKSLGYDGIEIPLKSILHFGKDKFKTLMADNNMEVVVMVIKFCLSLFPSFSLSLSHPLSIYLSLTIYLSTSLSTSMSICVSVCLSACLPVCISIYLPTCLHAFLSVSSVCLSIYNVFTGRSDADCCRDTPSISNQISLEWKWVSVTNGRAYTREVLLM